MDIQTIFYLVGIIYMTLYTLLFIAKVILVFVIKKKVTAIYKGVERKYETIKEVVTHPQDVAASVGAAVANTAFTQATKFLKSKKK